MTASTANPADQPKSKANGRWLIATLGLLILLVSSELLLSWRMDPFGVLRDPRGRALLASEDERRAKYLLNQAYVPENYDGLIIGSSASMSWVPSELKGFHFYNDSVEGANASEEKKMVEQALDKGHFKVALMVAHPLITSFHDLGDGLDQASRIEALGSVSSFRLEYEMFQNSRHPQPELRFPDGRRIKAIYTQPRPGDLYTPYHITDDPAALADYRSLVAELQAHQVQVIYVTYPLYEPFREENQEILDRYLQTIHTQMPQAPIIDFNTPQYKSFRKDASNYVDKIHLSTDGSLKLSRMLNERMHQILEART